MAATIPWLFWALQMLMLKWRLLMSVLLLLLLLLLPPPLP